MNHPQHTHAFPLLAASLALVGVAVVGLFLTGVALVSIDRFDQLEPAVLSVSACLIGSLVGQLPVWRLASRQIDGVAMGSMLAVLVRVLATGIALALLVLLTGSSITLFAGWAAPAYLLFLGVEVWLIKRYLERRGPWVANPPATEQAL